MVVVATGAVNHAMIVDEVEQRFASFAEPQRPAPQPANFGGGTYIERQDLEQAHLALGLEGLPQRDPVSFQPADFLQHDGRRNVVAAVPGSAGNPRALLFDL